MKLIKIERIFKNRVLQHALFWFTSYYILLELFANSNQFEKIDFIYTALFHISLIIGVYINLYLLIPGFLSRRYYFLYCILLLIVIAGSTVLNILFFEKLVDYILPEYYFISYYEFTDILKFVVVYIAVSSLIKLAKSWFVLFETTKKISELEKEKVEIELKALRAQINPHFLFNSLNVLYSLALKKSDESPDAIIKLSDILRYVIYGSNKDFVSVEDEIKLIGDYLSLQKYRVTSNSNIGFKFELKEENLKISPMIFLPLVENSFKHGVKGDIENAYVEINLKAKKHEIIFEIENNKGVSGQPDIDKNSGIGISNIKDRLNLIYPDKHDFEITESEKYFRIKLIIKNED